MDYIIGFLVLLCVLVFIHEFGHFYVAKLCGMKVEVFSIGMGLKLLKFKKGETEYALSLFPLGGYVKILGQDPREEVAKHEEHRSFKNKATWQKAAVVLAGPIANLVLAFFVLAFVYMKGAPTTAPVFSRVVEGSPAALAGFQNGDWVESIQTPNANIEIKELSQLQDVLDENLSKSLTFTLKRGDENSTITYTPTSLLQRHPKLGVMEERGTIDGVEYFAPAASVTTRVRSWADQQSLPYPFQITQIQYTAKNATQATTLEIENFYDFESGWSKAISEQSRESGQIVLKGYPIVDTPDGQEASPAEEQEHNIAWNHVGNAPASNVNDSGFVSTEMYLFKIVEGSPAAKAGLKTGDILQSVNGEAMTSFVLFKRRIQELASKGETIHLEWLRNGELLKSDVNTRVVEVEDEITKVDSKQFQIGAAFLALKAPPPLTMIKASSLGQAAQLGWHKTSDLVRTMLTSFYHLLVGNISINTLGGPITIAKVSGDSFTRGLVPFLQMMAFISLNLFILNLFPIPVLDGGHLVLFAVESILRRPVSIKALEIWTTTGVVFLLMIMGVALFNDIDRMGLFQIFKS
ncbi:RIP metalloprotease RseP [bacterium]|nr:RIP metalloprotease RseP [bacterium]